MQSSYFSGHIWTAWKPIIRGFLTISGIFWTVDTNAKLIFMFLKTEFWRIKKNCHQFLGFIRESVLKPPSALPYNFTAEDVRWVNICSAKSSNIFYIGLLQGKIVYSCNTQLCWPKYLLKTIYLYFVLCGIVKFYIFCEQSYLNNF